ncbi:MAG: fibronectin type III domain-containing protein, partial [Chloroflexi bacterium]|nr:fibronectin type III domain-containing protein [Chloroflexota bacterium]
FDALSLGDGVSKWGVVRWGDWDGSGVQFITTDHVGEADVVWNLQPPEVELLAPVLLVVSDGAADALVLYWTGGPDNATSWQYRTRGPWYGDRAAWGEWTDIRASEAAMRSFRLTGLGEGMSYGIQVRGVVGEVAGPPSDSVWHEVPTVDTNGVPWLPTGWGRVAEGGRAWRVGETVVDVPAGMRVSAEWQGPVDPMPPHEEIIIADVQSGSMLGVSTDFGAECWRDVRTSAPGRDVSALFDQIIASARVQLEAEPHLTATTPGDGGVVTLRWVGGADDATRWEYRLHGPHPIGGEGPWPEAPWGRWTEVPGSYGETRSHSVRGLPEGTAWVFQVRAVAGSVAGAPSVEALGGTAVVGPDGIPQLHDYPQWGEGGRTWRLHDSPTVIDVPVGLVVGASSPGHYSDGQIGVSEQTTGHWILVDVEAATEMALEGGIVSNERPCGVGPAGLWQLFEQMRASLRLQPVER